MKCLFPGALNNSTTIHTYSIDEIFHRLNRGNVLFAASMNRNDSKHEKPSTAFQVTKFGKKPKMLYKANYYL